MEAKIIEKSKNKLFLELPGEGHTLLNPLSKELMANKDVEYAGYYIEHPVVNVPRLLVQTKSKDPAKVIEEAVKGVKKTTSDMLKAAQKALK